MTMLNRGILWVSSLCATNFLAALLVPFLATCLLTTTGCSSDSTQPTSSAASSSQATASSNAATSSSQSNTSSRFGSLESFTATAFDGGNYNQDIFADYNLTMVNIWTTTCGFCIEEMPGLEMLYQSLPEGVNLIGICADATYDQQTAEAIIEETGITFTNLMDSTSLNQSLLNNVDGVPTTVFVDSTGALVGQPQVGAPTTGSDMLVAQAYKKLIDEHLEELN